MPHLAIATCTNCRSTKYICANYTREHNVFFLDCPVYKFELEFAALRFKHGQTLTEATQEARLSIPSNLRLAISPTYP